MSFSEISNNTNSPGRSVSDASEPMLPRSNIHSPQHVDSTIKTPPILMDAEVQVNRTPLIRSPRPPQECMCKNHAHTDHGTQMTPCCRCGKAGCSCRSNRNVTAVRDGGCGCGQQPCTCQSGKSLSSNSSRQSAMREKPPNQEQLDLDFSSSGVS